MKHLTCLILLAVFSRSVYAQKSQDRKWVIGAEFSYANLSAEVAIPLEQIIVQGTAPINVPLIDQSGGEGGFGLHAGRLLNRYSHVELIVALSLVGVGITENNLVIPDGGRPTYTTADFEGGDASGFITTAARFVFEPQEMRFPLHPRGAAGVAWAWTKGPSTFFTAGFSTGNERTRFTLNVGVQYTWLGYDTHYKTFRSSDNTLISELTRRGTERMSGTLVRMGVEHFAQ